MEKFFSFLINIFYFGVVGLIIFASLISLGEIPQNIFGFATIIFISIIVYLSYKYR